MSAPISTNLPRSGQISGSAADGEHDLTDFDGAAEILRTWGAGLTPDPDLTVSQWADKHRMLSGRASAEPGRYRTARTPYMREIMDRLSPGDPTQRIVFMKAAQVGATEAGNNWIGFAIHQAPGPMLAVQPTVELAKRNSRQRIDPLIEESPDLRERVKPARSRDAGNTMLSKEFAGGILIMTGANSAVGLRSTPARYIFLDEVDAYPASADEEGDPVTLAEARSLTFAHRRKVFLVSTPTIRGLSRIEREYEASDQRRFFVPCPHCDHAQSVTRAIEDHGWDGAWYRRGTFDDGTALGSAASEECRIDSIAQSWAVLSGAADPDRARMAMASVMDHLVRPDPGLVLLFTPPFDATPLDPGYIKGYPPGLRENGGQYSHAAMWTILAQARLGDGNAAHRLFALLNPVNHALTPEDTQRYKVEPYVVAADVYSTAPHEGRGGWTWYTGSAGWMYRAGVEGIVGLTRAGQTLHLNPCLPQDWPEVGVTVRLGDAHYTITIRNPDGVSKGIAAATLDGTSLAPEADGITLPLQDGKHEVTLVLGRA